MLTVRLLFLLITTAWLSSAGASARPSKGRRYQLGELVPLEGYIVGPYRNPPEAYPFYRGPLCRPPGVPTERVRDGFLSGVVGAERLVGTPYRIPFREDVQRTQLCELVLNETEVQFLKQAVREDYYFQMFLDDLPSWGFLGRTNYACGLEPPSLHVFRHLALELSYRGDQVLEVNVFTDPTTAVDIINAAGGGLHLEMTYSVKWKEASPTDQRLVRYTRYARLPQHTEIHVIGLCVSLAVVLLAGFILAAALQRARTDSLIHFASLANGGAADATPNPQQQGLPQRTPYEESWVYCEQQMLRNAPWPKLLAACMGVGAQLAAAGVLVSVVAFTGAIAPYSRGSWVSAYALAYMATAPLSGYLAAVHYHRLCGEWSAAPTALSTLLFAGPALALLVAMRLLADRSGWTASGLEWAHLTRLLVLWKAVACPLGAAGGLAARKLCPRGEAKGAPVDIAAIAAKLPSAAARNPSSSPSARPRQSWRSGFYLLQFAFCGCVTAAAAYNELYYVFITWWGHKLYTVPGFLVGAVVAVAVASGCLSAAFTCDQVVARNKGWWWRSFMCGGSTAVFMFLTCVYFCAFKTDMGGPLQLTLCFAGTLVACYAVFLLLGAVCCHASLAMVTHMYTVARRVAEAQANEAAVAKLAGI